MAMYSGVPAAAVAQCPAGRDLRRVISLWLLVISD